MPEENVIVTFKKSTLLITIKQIARVYTVHATFDQGKSLRVVFAITCAKLIHKGNSLYSKHVYLYS